MKKGTLYGIGVGPGDPELITIKAVSILQKMEVIFTPFSSKNTYSLAQEIISKYIRDDAKVIKLPFPMTKEKDVLKKAWKENTENIARYINKGKDAAFVTLGDPMTYSTFGYIKKTMEQYYPDIKIEIVPGITSYHAALARAGRILVESEESFTVISGAMGAEKLKKIARYTDTIIMLKVYKHFSKIKDALQQLGIIDDSVLVSRCGLNGEEIITDIKKKKGTPPYLSLLIIRTKKDKK